MNDALRNKLIELGIPLERQDAASLLNLFPPAFKVANFGLSEDDVAQVLVAFVERGLISLTPMSGDAAASRPVGAHVCHFYRDENEMTKMTATFLEEGLRSGERALWILPEWLDGARARAAARVARPELADAEASGRIRFMTSDEVYFDAKGVIRGAEGIIQFWLDEEQKARAIGFSGLRIAGDGTALVSNENWKSGADYESLADKAFQGHTITALCCYSLANVSPDRLAEVLSGHDCGVVHRGGVWNEIRSGAGVAAAIEFLQSIP